MSLADYTIEELYREIERRRKASISTYFTRLQYGCSCGEKRKEITEKQGGCLPRTGCLTCERWDGPVVLEKP